VGATFRAIEEKHAALHLEKQQKIRGLDGRRRERGEAGPEKRRAFPPWSRRSESAVALHQEARDALRARRSPGQD